MLKVSNAARAGILVMMTAGMAVCASGQTKTATPAPTATATPATATPATATPATTAATATKATVKTTTTAVSTTASAPAVRTPISFSAPDFILTAGLCAITTLLVLFPIGRYLAKPWAFRRDRLYGILGGDAIVFYYKQFRPGSKIGAKRVGDATLTSDQYLSSFCSDFEEWYGRKYYIAPLVGLAILSFAVAWWGIVTAWDWITGYRSVESMHGLIAAALAGGFVWVISDELDRLRRRDFTSTDIYYYVFRILLAIPFGWALTRLTLTLQVGIPTAFFLGAFPTTTLFTAARRIAGQQLKLGDSPTGALELEKLQSIGKDNAERFKDEGIATITQLAYADPVDLTIRTNFDFSYVVDCVSQALLWLYISPDARLITLSFRGAQEIAIFVGWLTDPHYAVAAQSTLTLTAKQLNVTEEALMTTLYQIAKDPYTEFLVNAWR